MLIRIRQEMAEKENHLLEGMVEFNETNVGGKPRMHGQPKGKRSRGTNKIPAIGAIEGGGKVVTKILSRVTIYEIEQFELSCAKLGKPKIITDEYKGYI